MKPKPAYLEIEFTPSGLPLRVIVELKTDRGIEIAGGTPCIHALDRKEESFEAEWILPRSTVQKILGKDMPQATVTAAEVAKAGGGWVYAAVTNGHLRIAGFGLIDSERGKGAVKIHGTWHRVRVLGVLDAGLKSMRILSTEPG